MPFSLFPMHSFLHVSHLYVFLSFLQLTWLADPALVTSVYPNRMQYMPRVLQEVSLLDGVDAGVCGNGRRFSKTSSYPPCHCYAFILFYPYFLTVLGSAILPPSCVPERNPMFPYVVLLYVFLCFQPVSALHLDLSPLYCTSHYFTSFTSVYLSISHPSPIPPIFLSVCLDYPQTPLRLAFHPIYPCSS